MAGYSPFMRSVTVGVSALQLSVLLAAVEPNFPTRLGVLNLQSGAANTGHIYVGNSGVTAANCGADIIPLGSVNIPQSDMGLILTTDVFILSTNAVQQLNVMAIPFGQ
jgi:hypothetical protein